MTLFALLLVFFGASAFSDDFVLVASDEVSTDTLSKSQAKRILTGQSATWPDGSTVQIVLPPGTSAEAAWLSKQILKMPPEIVERYVLERAFAATIPSPVRAGTSQDSANSVIDATNAIGVLPSSMVTDGIKVIRIE